MVTQAEKLTIRIQFEITRPVAAIKSPRFALLDKGLHIAVYFLKSSLQKLDFYSKSITGRGNTLIINEVTEDKKVVPPFNPAIFMFFVVYTQIEFNFGNAYFLEQYPLYWFYDHSYQGYRYLHDAPTNIYICAVYLYFHTMLDRGYPGPCYYVYIICIYIYIYVCVCVSNGTDRHMVSYYSIQWPLMSIMVSKITGKSIVCSSLFTITRQETSKFRITNPCDSPNKTIVIQTAFPYLDAITHSLFLQYSN